MNQDFVMEFIMQPNEQGHLEVVEVRELDVPEISGERLEIPGGILVELPEQVT